MHDTSPSLNGASDIELRRMVEQHDAEIYGRGPARGLREIVNGIEERQRAHGRLLWAVLLLCGLPLTGMALLQWLARAGSG